MFIDFYYSMTSLRSCEKAYVFDPVESPVLMSADVSSIREFLRRQYQEYRIVWAERVAERA